MPIHKRAAMHEDTNRGRHPLLRRPDHFMVYSYVDENPGSTLLNIRQDLKVKHQRVSELVDAGLLRVVGKTGKYNQYETVRENMTGAGRDRVEVEVTVYVNEYGEFTADTKVVGQVPFAGDLPRVPVVHKRYTVMVPRPNEPYVTRPVVPPAVSGSDTSPRRRVIDAEYEDVIEAMPERSDIA